MMLLFLSWFLNCNGTKWPTLCLCAVKKLLTHSPLARSVAEPGRKWNLEPSDLEIWPLVLVFNWFLVQ